MMSVNSSTSMYQCMIAMIILFIEGIYSSVTTQATFRNHLGNNLAAKDTAFSRKVGYVTIYANLVWYDLDFSNIDWTQFESNCTEEGLSFHIHDQWTYGDTAGSIGSGSADRMGIECHENFTGGHFDPWYACGPTSEHQECENNGGCIPPSSIYEESEYYQGQYSCDPENFNLIAYSCEVGDLSGKYGWIDATDWDNNTNETVGIHTWDIHGSYWEVLETVLAPGLDQNLPAQYSLVIHCGDAEGEPLFCAPIVRDNNNQIPNLQLSDNETITTDLSEAGPEFENFTISFTNDGISFHIPATAGPVCNEWYLLLYEDYPYYEDGPAFHNCDIDEFGGIYDPTHTCIENSGSAYCQDGLRCPGPKNISANYDCSMTNNYMGCAVGDISSRIDLIIPDFTGGNQFWDFTFDLTENSPPLFILNDRGIVLTCLDGNNATFNETENICGGTFCDNCTQTLAPIETHQPTPDTTNPTSVPTNNPTTEPTTEPSNHPTTVPTNEPTKQPSKGPTKGPTKQPTNEDDQGEDDDDQGLDAGATAGIVIGGVAFLAICVLLLWCFVIKPRKGDDKYNTASQDVEINKMKSHSEDDDGRTNDADDTVGLNQDDGDE